MFSRETISASFDICSEILTLKESVRFLDKLVTKEEIAQAAKLKSNNPLVGILYRLSGIERVNRFYDQLEALRDLEFTSKALELLELQIEVDPAELERIPKEGAFITVSNHPYGAIDGITLIDLVTRQRPDFRVMANFLLQRIPQLSNYFFGVNPFGEQTVESSNFRGTKEALLHLKAGKPIGIFPAGEVSTFNKDLRTITDGPWATQSIKLIQKAGVPVVPIYFDGKNSRLFHLLGVIHPTLRTLRLPAELMNKKGRTLRIRIGKPIAASEIASFDNSEQLARFLRAKTYAIGSSLDIKREYFKDIVPAKKPVPIAEPIPYEILKGEIDLLPERCALFEQQNFVCYLASANQAPNILKEIGRLREITFRAVGEGTNKSRDIDEYDLYYHHLILWDKEKHAIAGAYRIGKGMEIMRRYSHRGFYCNSLFKFAKTLHPLLEQTIELGRSFITEEYQRQRLPLFLLWKGILVVLISNPEYRYIMGPVTISGSYQEVSKGLIMAFVQRHFYDEELAQYVTPRKPYTAKNVNVDNEALLGATENDLKKLDKIISEIEPSSFTIPVLLKKYLHQNARILGFNLDPKFNNALDGLMLLDLHNLPAETVENLQKEFGTNGM